MHNLRRPHQRSRPEPGPRLQPSGGRTPHGAAAPRKALSLGVLNKRGARRSMPALPAHTPTPPALACFDLDLELLRLAPPAVSTAAEESLRADSAERRWWWRRRPQSWRWREGRLEPGGTPTPPALATGLLTRPAAASVTPGHRGPAVCSGARRRGLLGRAPGGGAAGEFAAPRLQPPARALPHRPASRCLREDAWLQPLALVPPGFRFRESSWTRFPW